MSNIYSAKFMNEASYTLPDKVFKRPANETYLFSAMNILREMNNIINKDTEKLYIQIAEAESKEEENKLFANYFYQFKNVFETFTNKLEEMKSRMIISTENKIDTWKDLIDDDSYISSFDKEFSYSGWEFSHIGEGDYPRLNLYKLYQKEFDYLGMLMQDTGIGASPSAKLKIIASVSNNFANQSNSSDWIKNLVTDMIDVDEKEFSRSYSENLYNALRDKHEFNVDKGLLYTCKESLADYEDAIDAASKLCDNLLYELNKIANDISSYLFRNQDKKLKIKTDTDGIIDRDYRLDTYSMNQLDMFMKNKINQIKKVLNVFSIAVGIKFDTVIDYIDQNISILKKAKEYCQNISDNVDSEITSDPGINIDNNDIDDDSDSSFSFDDDDTNSGYNDDTEFELDNKSEDNSVQTSDVVNDDSEEFEEAYLFESELFELELMSETYAMHQVVREALLMEDGEQPSTPATSEPAASENQPASQPAQQQNQNNDNSQLNKLANQNKQNIFQKIIAKLRELWKKFKEVVFNKTKDKIEYLKKNANYIAVKVTGAITLKYTPNFKYLNSIKIPDLNYKMLKESLESEDKFFKEKIDSTYPGGISISDHITNSSLGKEQKQENGDGISLEKIVPTINDAYNFCVNYQTKINPLSAQMNILEKAQKVAQDPSKIQESVNTGFMQYFTEMEDKTNDSDKVKRINTYFNVCSRVLAAQMTCYQKLFNELYAYCKWYITQAGGSQPKNDKQEPTA